MGGWRGQRRGRWAVAVWCAAAQVATVVWTRSLLRRTGQSNTFRTDIPSKGALLMIFFSNRLGCLGSVVVSILLTVIASVIFHLL